MLRLGLCCLFKQEKIKFRTATVAFLKDKTTNFQKKYLSEIIVNNCQSLQKALVYCLKHQIGSFRITSRFFPLFTHPLIQYKIEDLPKQEQIFYLLNQLKDFNQKHNLRLTLHPDQFVVLNSPDIVIVQNAIKELEYHNYLADLTGADVINLHGGGKYQNKKEALKRLKDNLQKLSSGLLKKLTLENDDKSFSPEDLIGLCQETKIPFVYDVHHHRCLKDSLSEEEATKLALKTWDREPLFHLSSPKVGWKGSKLKEHADYIAWEDFPTCWLTLKKATIEIEAKAKELALKKLISELQERKISLQPNIPV